MDWNVGAFLFSILRELISVYKTNKCTSPRIHFHHNGIPQIDTLGFGLQITITLAHRLYAKWMYFRKFPASFYKITTHISK
jgi:hypothetical protein